jgi:penicillin-binding protein 1A
VGIHKVIDMAHRFGVTSNIPAYLPVALGAVEITLEEQVVSYSVFPNDGVRVSPRLIRKVSNADGIELWEEKPSVNAVIGQQTARTMMTLLKGVTQHGTGQAAAKLNHPLGGKTGTTSDFTDAWFLGFSPSITCGVWIGYDNRESLGEKETGAVTALPVWITFMKAAIAGKDDEQFPGDEEPSLNDRAAAEPPAAGPAIPPHLSRTALDPSAKPASSAPGQTPAAQPAAKPSAAPHTAGRPAHSLLPPVYAPPKPQGTVRRALNPNP